MTQETRTEQLNGTANGTGRERGFTLIETCIALIIMMVAALSIASDVMSRDENQSSSWPLSRTNWSAPIPTASMPMPQ